MQSIRSISPVVRAIGVIGAVAILVTSITYAALQSQVTLTDNTIATGTADLQINNTDDTVTGFGDTDTGFAFTGVVPGSTTGSSVGNFQLKNNGTAGMTIAVQIPTAPVWTVVPTSTVDNSKVTVNLSCTDADETYTVTDTLANLIAGDVNFTTGTLAGGDTATCTAKITMAADAFTGESASASNFDFKFTGTAV